MKGRGEVGANFGIVGSSIPTFLIAVMIIQVISISRTVFSFLTVNKINFISPKGSKHKNKHNG